MDALIRDVDCADASMTIEELNSLVVSLRQRVKYAKTAVIRNLAKKVRFYTNKRKSSDNQQQIDVKRAASLQTQINFLLKADVDKVAKFCLGLTSTKEAIAKKGVPADIAMARVGEQKRVREKVAEWRQKHPDWKILSSFLNEHISRRHKNRTGAMKKTDRLLKQKEADEAAEKKGTPEDDSDEKVLNDVLGIVLQNKPVSSGSKVDAETRQKDVTVEEDEDSDAEDSGAEDSEDSEDEDEGNSEDDEPTDGDAEDASEDNSPSDEDSEEEKPQKTIKSKSPKQTDSTMSKEVKGSKKAASPKKVEAPQKVQDSFFLDSCFMTDADKVMKPSSGKNMTAGPQKRKPNSFDSRNNLKKFKPDSEFDRKSSNKRFSNNQTESATKHRNSNFGQNPTRGKNQGNAKGGKGAYNKDSSAAKEAESLHPSWAARKKEKEKVFMSFKPDPSKVIVFDD